MLWWWSGKIYALISGVVKRIFWWCLIYTSWPRSFSRFRNTKFVLWFRIISIYKIYKKLLTLIQLLLFKPVASVLLIWRCKGHCLQTRIWIFFKIFFHFFKIFFSKLRMLKGFSKFISLFNLRVVLSFGACHVWLGSITILQVHQRLSSKNVTFSNATTHHKIERTGNVFLLFDSAFVSLN